MAKYDRGNTVAMMEASALKAKAGPTKPPVSPLANILLNNASPAGLSQELHKTVIGQEEAIRRCAVALRHHILQVQHCFIEGINAKPLPKHTILLVGPTGVGKTILAKAMSEVLEVPYHCEDCTGLSETGYVGRDPADITATMADRWKGSLVAEYGLLFLDELDKVAIRPTNHRDIRGAGVQDSLLKLIEGDSVQPTSRRTMGSNVEEKAVKGFRTDRLLIIAAGAFVGLSDIVKNRTKPASRLGFSAQGTRADSADAFCGLDALVAEDLISYGLKPELVGRFTDIVTLQDLGRDDLLTILNMEGGPISKRQRIAKMEGFDLKFTPCLQEAIVDECLKASLGARMLESVVGKLTARLFYEVPGQLRGAELRQPLVTLDAAALSTGEFAISEQVKGLRGKRTAEA